MFNTAKLKSKIASLPNMPGVYIFKDVQGKVIYIGKANSIKKRVQSYFNRTLSSKTLTMVSKIADIEYKLTASASQAQLLEASLVKDKQPQYNISLKDDKSFPWIRVTDEDFPIVSITRRKKSKEKDTAVYFGPYTNAKLLNAALKTIRRIFGFRSCKKMPKEACLYGRIKLCPAPCISKISPRQYKEIIKDIDMFLDFRHEELLNRLNLKMQEVARGRKFEEAIKIRDQINALSIISRGKTYFSSQVELEDLKNLLKLDKVPNRIEAFDISNIKGKESTGSMVSFYKSVSDKNNYRKFRIKTTEGIDDYKMLSEVIQRRYSRVLRENSSLPDLILIDGGRSHLFIADKEIKKLGVSIPLVSIAKDKENIYTKNRKNPIKLNFDTPALNLLRRIRDEAHRFALRYHHLLRRKKIIGK